LPADALGLARELISFPTVSRDSNLPLVEFVSECLHQFDIDCLLQPDDAGRKANLVATIGPADVPGIVLAGHTDVVPVDGQDWTTPPFDPLVMDGRLYGRGSCDMKGFIAAVLSRVPDLVGQRLQVPIHLVLTYDEEVGCHGANAVTKVLAAHVKKRPLACIVGEPTGMEIVDAHKGMRLLRTTVSGGSGHSSGAATGGNAIAVLARLACHLAELGERASRGAVRTNFEFARPYTTVNLGVVRGGTAVNIIPETAQLEWEYRHLPNQDGERVLEEFREFCRELERSGCGNAAAPPKIFTDELARIPGLPACENSDLARFLMRLTGASGPRQVDYCTEAGLYQERLGVPTVICGPGSIAQAHRPDEYLEIEQLDLAVEFLVQVADACESGAWTVLPQPPGDSCGGDNA
jgi:acetylornithine deacetylase